MQHPVFQEHHDVVVQEHHAVVVQENHAVVVHHCDGQQMTQLHASRGL